MKNLLKRTRSPQNAGQGLLLILFSITLLVFMFYRPPWEYFDFKLTANLKQLLINVVSYINYRLFGLLGYGSFAALVLIGMVGWARSTKAPPALRKQRVAYAVVGTFMLSFLAGTYDLVFGDLVFKTGGWLGMTVIGFMSGLIGTVLTTIIMLLLGTSYILNVFQLKPSEVAEETAKVTLKVLTDAFSIIPVLWHLLTQFLKYMMLRRKSRRPVIRKQREPIPAAPRVRKRPVIDPEKTILETPPSTDSERTIIERQVRTDEKNPGKQGD
ncbi:DNA translocase FtsK 4TM domain-containing protein [candidate division KSB1 bacterium]